MSYEIKQESFTLKATDKNEAFGLLLALTGHTVDSFSKYMDTTVEELETAPAWALKYLGDTFNLELLHLGYIMKDTKTPGLIGEYNNVLAELDKLEGKNLLKTTMIPIRIKDSIITEGGSIKIAYIARAEDILKDFRNNNTI